MPKVHRHIRPAATLHDTLIMLMKAKTNERITTRLSGGLCLAYDPGVSFSASRTAVRPSPTELKVLCTAAKSVGLLIEPSQGAPDQVGATHIVRWIISTTLL